MLHQTPPPTNGMPKRRGATGDTTFSTVVKLVQNSRLEFLERTCAGVERSLAILDYDPDTQWRKQRLVELLYWREGYTVEKVAQELKYSARAVYRWKADILMTVAEGMGYLA